MLGAYLNFEMNFELMNEMYRVTLPYAVYGQWQVYSDYSSSNEIGFPLYVMERYPEVLGIGYIDGSRTFDFESEDHYHWFLLQQ